MAKQTKKGVRNEVLGRKQRPLGPLEVQGARTFRTGCGTQNRRVFPIAPSVSVESVMRSMPDSCRHLQTLATVQHGSIAMQALVNDAA